MVLSLFLFDGSLCFRMSPTLLKAKPAAHVLVILGL